MSDDRQTAQFVAELSEVRQRLVDEQAAHAGTTNQLTAATGRIGELEAALKSEQDAHAATSDQLGAALSEVRQSLANERAAHADTTGRLTATAAQSAVLAASLKAEQNAHAATASQLAAARAEITQAAGLREQVTVLTAKLAAAQATADDLAASRQKANQLTDQVAELRAKYEAAPPAGSGISAVSGYVTSDGVFHAALPDAQHHAAVLGLMADANLSAAAAEALIGKRERIIAHLAPLGAAAPAPAKSAT